MEPNSDASDLDSSYECVQGFGIASGDASPAFQRKESVLYEMAHFVEITVIVPLLNPIAFGRYDGFHAIFNGIRNDFIRIISTICQKDFSIDALYQVESLFTIRSSTFCNNNLDWHTMRIHGQMYLGVEPPFVFAIA